jgi:hypothetical protein
MLELDQSEMNRATAGAAIGKKALNLRAEQVEAFNVKSDVNIVDFCPKSISFSSIPSIPVILQNRFRFSPSQLLSG